MERPNENLFSYLRWRGDLSFAADPLNEVDALAFAVFSYLDYSAVPDGLDLKSAAAVVKKTMVSPRTSLAAGWKRWSRRRRRRVFPASRFLIIKPSTTRRRECSLPP